MKVDDLPLPSNAIEALKKRGVRELFPPQELAVKAGVLEGENVVVAAPTASGKTLIAVLAALATLLENKGKTLYLTPLRSLASEKYEDFKSLFGELGFSVAMSVGDFDSSDPWLNRYDLIIATNEKADSLLRHGAPWMKEVSLVVVDEVHLVNEPDRGPTLELLVSRLKRSLPDAQFVCLSATITNLMELASWLDAKPVASDWRPVELKEGVYYDGAIEFADGSGKEVDSKFRIPILDLVYDSLKEGGQVLIFTFRRRSTVSLSSKLYPIVEHHLSEQEKRALRELAKRLLAAERNTVTERLAELIAKGVAFHHAGLSYHSRKLVEDGFRRNLIKTVVATPTLAAGVNLPARRVIISERRRYNVELGIYENISVMEYKQMAGRAGRPGYDKVGEAVLIARTLDEFEYLMEEYVKATPERIVSKLATERSLRSQLLAEIASGFARSLKELDRTLEHSLYARQFGDIYLKRIASRVLRELHENGFIEILDEEDAVKATELGKRVSELYLDPRTATTIIRHITLNRAFSEITYLHVISMTPDMPKLYLRRRDRSWLDAVVDRISDEIAVEPPDDPDEYEFFLASLKVALLLLDWIEERPDDYIYEKYDIGPGDLYSITQTGEWLLYAASELARLLSLHNRAKELKLLRERVKYGVKAELLELTRIKGIGRVRARALYSHGFRSLADIARADERLLARVPTIGPTLARKLKEAILTGRLEVEQAAPLSLMDYLQA